MILRIWLYRFGLNGVDSNNSRAVFGETWLSTDPEVNTADVLTVGFLVANHFRAPFGSHPGLLYNRFEPFIERVFPKREMLQTMSVGPRSAPPVMNVAAPEAAFRLQRVGAAADHSKYVGRLTLPILTDTYYTDLPHRRHIDTATLSPRLALFLELQPKSYLIHGRTYTNVVWNRRALDWSPVTNYVLLSNPVRVWQRSRVYDHVGRGTADSTWSPVEL